MKKRRDGSLSMVSASGEIELFRDAILEGDLDQVVASLEDGINEIIAENSVNAPNALMWLASQRWDRSSAIPADAAAKIIEWGVDPLHRNLHGDSALEIAATSYPSVPLIGVLIDNGLPVDGNTKDGSTALMKAAARRYTDAVSYLLAKHADPNAADSDVEWTALHWAANSYAEEEIGILLSHGADPRLKNAQGESAVDMVRREGYPCHGCRDLIESHLNEMAIKTIEAEKPEGLIGKAAAKRDMSL